MRWKIALFIEAFGATILFALLTLLGLYVTCFGHADRSEFLTATMIFMVLTIFNLFLGRLRFRKGMIAERNRCELIAFGQAKKDYAYLANHCRNPAQYPLESAIEITPYMYEIHRSHFPEFYRTPLFAIPQFAKGQR